MYSLHDEVQAVRGLADQTVVVQDITEPDEAVEPIGALLHGSLVRLPRVAAVGPEILPCIMECRMILVQMARDSLAGRHRPVAQPARRFDGARREGKECRFDRTARSGNVLGRRLRRRGPSR